MKNSIFLLLALSLMLTCCKSESAREEESLQVAIEEAENAQITETKLFLDFKFGMSRKEVDKHFEDLLKKKKIFVNDKGEYQYEFNYHGSMKFFLAFSPEFFEDKLYIMNYTVEDPDGYDPGNHVFLMHAFKKTKHGFRTFITNDVLGGKMYTNILGNMIVRFKKLSQSVMIYENAPISKNARENEKQKEKNKVRESVAEF